MSKFKVSVIIPVFNAANFVKYAVESAIKLPQVGEIILIEDGSVDNSFLICLELEKKYSNVKLFTHDSGKNLGAGVSRNLGIKLSSFEYISFLDADDWYLSNRFELDEKIFSENKEVQIIFSMNALGFNDRYEYFGKLNLKELEYFKINDVLGTYQHIISNDLILGHPNSTTFKKSIFNPDLLFDPRLDLHQDTELWNRVSRRFLFYPGEFSKPVSIIRKHSSNRIEKKSLYSLIKYIIVYVDNIGVENVYDFEERYIVEFFSRNISNSIKFNFLRKILFKTLRNFLFPFKRIWVIVFYWFGIKYYKL